MVSAMPVWKISYFAAAALALPMAPQTAFAQSSNQATLAWPPQNYFLLQVVDPLGNGRCLEANGLSETSVLKGATFLDHCQTVTGQAWQGQPAEGGGFQLISMLHGSSRCLAINTGQAADLPLNVPFMSHCAAGGAVFTSSTGGSGQAFSLSTMLEGREVCLTARPPETSLSSAVPVLAIECDGAGAQNWQVVNAGSPVASPTQAVVITGRDAECLWNDGTSDQPDYFACRVEEAPNGSGFLVIGTGYEFRFDMDPDDDLVARGELQIGEEKVNTGRFEFKKADLNCWQNHQSGERLCIID
jgi:hypothetical protein